jgi:hypothetical protein
MENRMYLRNVFGLIWDNSNKNEFEIEECMCLGVMKDINIDCIDIKIRI